MREESDWTLKNFWNFPTSTSGIRLFQTNIINGAMRGGDIEKRMGSLARMTKKEKNEIVFKEKDIQKSGSIGTTNGHGKRSTGSMWLKKLERKAGYQVPGSP